MVNEEEKIKTLTEDISLLENYIHDLFSFTPLPLCFVNPKGMVLEVNPAFAKATGYDEYDIVGENLSLFMEKRDAEEILETTIKEGLFKKEKINIKTKDKKNFPVTVFAKSRKIKGEGVNGAFFSFFDLRDVVKKEEEVKESKEKLEEKIGEMEKINSLTIGREIKMVELKEEIEKLKKELEKYKEGLK